MRRATSMAAIGVLHCFALPSSGASPGRASARCPPRAPRRQSGLSRLKAQTRIHGQAVPVDPVSISIDDGDSVLIHWPGGDEETVRILGIDSPEVRHDEHGIPLDQSFGPEARAFAQGAFAAATEVKLIRAGTLDPYGRTLGYLIVNNKNYSVLIVRARLAEESVSHYGDNGLPGWRPR